MLGLCELHLIAKTLSKFSSEGIRVVPTIVDDVGFLLASYVWVSIYARKEIARKFWRNKK